MCTLAEQTELVVGVDYPASSEHVNGYNKIVEYTKDIKGFKKVTIFTTDVNLGPGKNLQRLYDYAYKFYDAVIFTEDDNEFSPCFLEFMNYSLNNFKDDESIMSIGGYTSEAYYGATTEKMILTYDTSAWGYGSWKNKFNFVGTEIDYYQSIVTSLNKSFRIFKTYPLLLSMLINMLTKGDRWGDTMYSSYNIINRLYQLRPSVSMARNWGQDGSGLHSGVDSSYANQVIQDIDYFDVSNISIERVKSETKKVNKCSFWMGLPRNRVHACLSLLYIIYKWFHYRISNSNCK